MSSAVGIERECSAEVHLACSGMHGCTRSCRCTAARSGSIGSCLSLLFLLLRYQSRWVCQSGAQGEIRPASKAQVIWQIRFAKDWGRSVIGRREKANALTTQAYAANVANVYYLSVTEASCTEVNTACTWDYQACTCCGIR